MRQVKVEFIVKGTIGDLSQYQFSELVANQLSISLMLRQLGVNDIIVGGHPFDLQFRRKMRDRQT